jgi:hypothetical protein
MDVVFNKTDGVVVKATFHPLNNHIIVILQENGPLQLVDIVETDNHVQIFPINEGCLFSSFCFGPEIDWMSLSVILLEKQGGIFALCPVLPKGSKLSKQIVIDMYDWLEEKQSIADRVIQKKQNKKYLDDAFGNSNSNDGYIFAGDSGNDYYLPTRIFSQKPRLQGPFAIDCLPTHRKKNLLGHYKTKKKEDNEILATDICTPYNSSDTNNCPVICISYSTGELDYLIFGDSSLGEYEDDNTDSIPSIGPAWLSDETSKKDIVSPLARLIFVETVSINDTSDANTINIPNGNWSIIPDPIHSHCLHMTNSSACVSYLISSDWLFKSIDCNNNVGDVNDTLVPSVCIPVFTRSDTKVSLCGVIIKYDPMIGHIALFRLSNGIFGIVNLSVHSRLCEWQNILVNFNEENNQNPLEEEYREFLKQRVQLKEKSDKLLKTIDAGLHPSTMFIGQKKLTEGRTESEKQDLLIRTTEHLEKEVILPLEDLNKRLEIKVEGINSFITIQENLIHGSNGLNEKMKDLSDKQQNLKLKIVEIQNRYDDQKNQMENCLSTALFLKSSISKGERAYFNQLKTWSQLTHRMSGTIDNLRRHAKAIKLQSLSGFNSSSNSISSPIATRQFSNFYDSPSSTGMSPLANRTTPGSSQMFVSPQKLPPTRSYIGSRSSQKGGSIIRASSSKSTPTKAETSNNNDIAYKSPYPTKAIDGSSSMNVGGYTNVSNINISTPGSFDRSSSAMKIQGETGLTKHLNTPSTPYSLNRSQNLQAKREPVLSTSEIEACKKSLLDQDEGIKIMMEEINKLEEKLQDHKKEIKNRNNNKQNNF